MRKLLFITFTVGLVLWMSSCSSSADDVDSSSSSTDAVATFSEDSSDYSWDASKVIDVQFNTSSASGTGDGLTISGTSISITKSGTYRFTGTLTGGQILVNATDSGLVRLLFNGVTMTNSTTSPLYIKKAGRAVINVVDGTTNSLSDASKYVYSSSTTEPDAAIFSNVNLAIFGGGSLTVKGNYADGISSDDGLLIKSSTVSVTAVDDAVRGKDYLVIQGGTLTAAAGTGHGLKSDDADTGSGYVLFTGGTIVSTSTSGDAVHGVNKVSIQGGNLTLTAASSQGIKGGSLVEISGGTTTVVSSHEGIESSNITVSGGVSIVNATNDAINATFGTVNGGSESSDGSYFYMKGGVLVANGSDAVDSNGNIEMTGGTLIANGPMSGVEEGVDCNGTFNVNGGVLIAAGSNSSMTKSMSTSSSQSCIYIKSSSAVSSSSLLHIEDASGNDIITFKPKNGGYIFHTSSTAMAKGMTCKIYTGGSYSGGSFVGGTSGYGLYTGGTYSNSGATLKSSPSLSTSSTVNSVSF